MDFVYDCSVKVGPRKQVLWIVYQEEIYLFTGEEIPKVVKITEEHRCTLEPDGSWSVSIYYLELVEGAIPCPLITSIHGRLWPEKDLKAVYRGFKERFGVEALSLENFKGCLRRDFPKTFIRMIEGEQNPWFEKKKVRAEKA